MNAEFSIKDQSTAPFAHMLEGLSSKDIATMNAAEFVTEYAKQAIKALNYSDQTDDEVFAEWMQGWEFDLAVSYIGNEINAAKLTSTDAPAREYTVVVERDERFTIEGLEFIANVHNTGDSITIEIDGGFGQDDDGDWIEVDGNYTVMYREITDEEFENDEYEITLTRVQIEDAKRYRQNYPVSIPE